MKQDSYFILFDSLNEFATWLEKQTVKRKITILQVHHTWKPDYGSFNGKNHFDLLNSMRNSHIKDRKFDDIAQQITTFPDGKLAYSLGRPFDKAPAGIKGANSNGVCVENIGNFDTGGDKISDKQKQTIIGLYAVMAKKFNIPIDTNHIVYHHWYDLNSGKRIPDNIIDKYAGKSSVPGYETKTCPGTAFFGGNTVKAAQDNFIPLIKEYFKREEVKEEIMKNFSKYFTDNVPEWIAVSADKLYDMGILAGKMVDGKRVLDHNAPITRGEIAVLLDRAVDYVMKNKK
jgi:N-acetylmuramoyl-L-alanine amidase.